jgi:hypothetical protein
MAGAAQMLPYTIKGGITSFDQPVVYVGTGSNQQVLGPPNSVNDSYWWYFLDNATQKMVYNVQVPGSQNSSVPAGINSYMTNPNIFFGVVTQCLSTLHVPQGALYDYLVNYGAGDGLNLLEQLNAIMSCGYFGQVSYVLIGQGGPGGGGQASGFEASSPWNAAILYVSLMSQQNGQPPYLLVDEYSF